MDKTSESTVAETRARKRGSARSRRAIPTLTLLAHPDASRVGERAVLGELVSGHTVKLARLEPDFCAPNGHLGRPIGDRHLSRRPVVIEATGDQITLSAESTPTAVRVNGHEIMASAHLEKEDLKTGAVIELAERIVLLLHFHTPNPGLDSELMGLIGHSDAIVQVRHEIRQVAGLSVGVLIRGETGTGKELVARALHEQSERAAGPFVDLNLGALPPSLAASELFGAARGAYTGSARSHTGCFGRADGGTLFLDEVGEAPAEIQVALLRALETGEIHPLGAGRPQRVDVRVIAATDADLAARIANGSFREPLLHRLAGYEILLPPLRDRREDSGRLLVHFLRQNESELGDNRLAPSTATPFIDSALMCQLTRFLWPGNVRQFRNVVRQLAIGNRAVPTLQSTAAVERLLLEPVGGPSQLIAPGSQADDTQAHDAQARGSEPYSASRPAKPRRGPSRVNEQKILEALRSHRFEVKAAAEALGFSRAALYKWIEENPRARTAGQLDEKALRAAHRELDGDLDALVDRLEVSRFSLRRRLRELGL